jgi:hypothetical protein
VTITGRSAKLIVAALTVSVILNFVAIGFAGSVIGGGLFLRGLVHEAASSYPRPLRLAFWRELRVHRSEVVASLRDFRQARAAQYQALTAEPFDRAAVEASQAKLRQSGLALATVLQSILTDSVASVPDDVRRAIPRAPPFGLGSLPALDRDMDEPPGQ